MAQEVGTIKSQVGGIAGKIARLETQLAMMASDRSKDEALDGLRTREQKLAKTLDDTRGIVSLLAGRVAGMDQRLKIADESVERLQTQLGKTREALKALATPASPTMSSPASLPSREASRTKKTIDLRAGTALFDRGRLCRGASGFSQLGSGISRRRASLVFQCTGPGPVDRAVGR